VAVKRPDLAPYTELIDPVIAPLLERLQCIVLELIESTTDTIEKSLLLDFVNSWNRLISFLEYLDSLANRNESLGPETTQELFEARLQEIILVVEKIQSKDGIHLKKEKIQEMISVASEILIRLSQKDDFLVKSGLTFHQTSQTLDIPLLRNPDIGDERRKNETKTSN